MVKKGPSRATSQAPQGALTSQHVGSEFAPWRRAISRHGRTLFPSTDVEGLHTGPPPRAHERAIQAISQETAPRPALAPTTNGTAASAEPFDRSQKCVPSAKRKTGPMPTHRPRSGSGRIRTDRLRLIVSSRDQRAPGPPDAPGTPAPPGMPAPPPIMRCCCCMARTVASGRKSTSSTSKVSVELAGIGPLSTAP